MSALHTTAAGVGPQKDTTSYNQSHADGPQYTLGSDAGSDDSEDQFQEESDFEEETQFEDGVDDSVREDMRKLENSFRGISDRFRLVNRIGEGISFPLSLAVG